jgi:hypothetical protein
VSESAHFAQHSYLTIVIRIRWRDEQLYLGVQVKSSRRFLTVLSLGQDHERVQLLQIEDTRRPQEIEWRFIPVIQYDQDTYDR